MPDERAPACRATRCSTRANTWANTEAYDTQAAARLRNMFRENFAKQNYAELGIKPAM